MAPLTVDEQWKFFAEFCRLELRAGGPDPHLKLSAEMSRGETWEERVWRGGCYIAVYNAPFAEAIWRDWSWEAVTAPKAEATLEAWLDDHFAQLITRRERRCVRRSEWMLDYLLSYREFACRLPDFLAARKELDPTGLYQQLWDEANTVRRLGRYVALKLLEYLRVACGVSAELPDLRARGGWSPREQLGYLFPEHARVAERDDSPELVELADALADEAQQRLEDEFDVTLDKFQLQVLLCDFKQSWKGKRQYPGRSIDSELEYARKAADLWGHLPSDIWQSRRRLFPPEHLGEVQGWAGPRADIAEVLAVHRYTWSDLIYDYRASRDLAHPAPRAAAPTGAIKGVWTILPGQLYQSGTWLQLSPTQAKARAAGLGVTGIVNVWHDDPRLAEIVPWYKHAWMSDGLKIDEALLDKLVHDIVCHVVDGGRVLVMCQMGRNRSGLVNALAARALLGCTGTEAVRLVRTGRPRALANETFAAYIEGLPATTGAGVPQVTVGPPPGCFF